MLTRQQKQTFVNHPDTLLADVLTLRTRITAEASQQIDRWVQHLAPERTDFAASLQNLAYYVALRRHDVRDLQEALRPLGLSSLGRIEAQVLPNIDAVIATLAALAGEDSPVLRPTIEVFDNGRDRLEDQTNLLFGKKPMERRVRIMVTLPPQAAHDAEFVLALVENGMNVARINCAHDTPEDWARMINHIRQAEQETGLSCKIAMDLGGPKSRTANLVQPKGFRVKKDDLILLTANAPKPIRLSKINVQVRCTLPEALEQIQVGHHVWFDDGKIGTTVVDITEDGVVLKVNRARREGDKLKEDKGINFPDTALALSPLTEKDLHDLDFVVQHADIINYSFVQSVDDIEQLQAEIVKRNPTRKPALVLKIETKRAVNNLPDLIASAGAHNPVGVMIARGDLAVEIGFERLAEMQEEIMWICEAAHVPVIWATQVLETLAKKGRPSRAEVTDAAMSERAECVMLNKGDYILDALDILDGILVRMSAHQSKKSPQLRALRSW